MFRKTFADERPASLVSETPPAVKRPDLAVFKVILGRLQGQSYMKEIKSNLFDNEVYYTAFTLLQYF